MARSIDTLQAWELAHPIRFKIWELYERRPTRSLAAQDLLRDLPDDLDVDAAQVAYHRRRLEKVELVGVSGGLA